jgi:tartrate dehydrogenase/decarboxylase / D-malate dehydrogenase
MSQIGLITSGGTGPELSGVFRLAAEAFAQLQGEPLEIVECPHTFRSFTELHGLTAAECTGIVERDLDELARFYRSFYKEGGRFLFRTAVNAETLYALRRELEAVKISHASLNGRRVTFVRDQHQGFYACDSWHDREDAIEFRGSFHKAKLRRIHDYSAAEAAAWLGADAETWFVYKHHLFANNFVAWISEICPHAAVLQPGMAFSKLSGPREARSSRPVLLIAGNEIGDLLQEVFTDQIGQYRETSCARNVYLHPDVQGLVEYQTVHGSADDLAGLQKVNPLATLRAAAELFENGRGMAGICGALEKAIETGFASGLLHSATRISQGTDQTAARIVEDAARFFTLAMAATA